MEWLSYVTQKHQQRIMDEAYAISCEQPVATMFPSCFVSTVPYIRELRDRERP